MCIYKKLHVDKRASEEILHNAIRFVMFFYCCHLFVNSSYWWKSKSSGKKYYQLYHLIGLVHQQTCLYSINQLINLFYFLLSSTSSMPLALYNGTHTLVWTHTYTSTYTVKYSTHTSIHTRQPFRRTYNVFISGTHTLTLMDVVSGPRLPYSW